MRTTVLVLGVVLGLLTAAAPGKSDEKAKKEPDPQIGGKTLDQWILDIRNSDPAVREAAMQTVPLYGKMGRKAVKALINELKDQDPSLRISACIALGVVGFDTEEQLNDGVKALCRLLQDAQSFVRLHAATTLGNIGPDARAAIPQLRSALRDSSNSWSVRRAAAASLAAVAMDQKEGPDVSAVMTLVGALSDFCVTVRRQAILSLVNLGKPSKTEDWSKEKSALDNALRDTRQDKVVIIWIHVLLIRNDKVSENHLSAIGQLLRNADPLVRNSAAQALATLGPQARSRIPDLIAVLDDKDLGVVASAMNALVQLQAGEPAVAALNRLAEGKDEVRQKMAGEAIKALTMTKDAKPTAPADPKKKTP
jgi:HEAT repeat protein